MPDNLVFWQEKTSQSDKKAEEIRTFYIRQFSDRLEMPGLL
jgi:hypothetical protein